VIGALWMKRAVGHPLGMIGGVRRFKAFKYRPQRAQKLRKRRKKIQVKTYAYRFPKDLWKPGFFISFLVFFSSFAQLLRPLRPVLVSSNSTILDTNTLPLRRIPEVTFPTRHIQIKNDALIIQMRDDARTVH
jgi:hypothetical protein